jgi:hypothetical protein
LRRPKLSAIKKVQHLEEEEEEEEVVVMGLWCLWRWR